MKRNPSLNVIQRNELLLEHIRKLKEEHPFWGYRRVWAHLTYVQKLKVNKKRVYRLMRCHQLLVTSQTRLRAKRSSNRAKPKAEYLNQIWGIDMTKFKTAEGWCYVVIVLDWYSKKIVGYDISDRSRTKEWLSSLEQGVIKQFPEGVRNQGLKLVSDNGCQPTSEAFMKGSRHLGIEQIFTSYNNPKGNAETERMMRTLKEELVWLQEWSSVSEAKEALTVWIEYYNANYLHSAHGYKPPNYVEQQAMEQAA